MLPKSHRLTRTQFNQVSRQGKSLAIFEATLKYLPNLLDHSRFGVVTSSKIDKRAVVRNRLRRRIYLGLTSSPSGFDVIIFPKSSMINLDDAKLSASLNQGLSKLLQLA